MIYVNRSTEILYQNQYYSISRISGFHWLTNSESDQRFDKIWSNNNQN